MQITTVGIDLAKNVFQLHAVDQHGKVVLKKQIKRDAADAEAICEAVCRPNMRFVPIKNVAQQAVLPLHRVRQGWIKARTAQANQIRGLLSEFGLIVPQGIRHITKCVPALLDEAKDELPGAFQELVLRLLQHFKDLDRQVNEMEHQIQSWHRANALSRKLEKILGIGPITASALVASVAMRRILRTASSWRHGWAWYPSSTRPMERRICRGSASVATRICAHYLSTALERSFDRSNARPMCTDVTSRTIGILLPTRFSQTETFSTILEKSNDRSAVDPA